MNFLILFLQNFVFFLILLTDTRDSNLVHSSCLKLSQSTPAPHLKFFQSVDPHPSIMTQIPSTTFNQA